MISSAVQPATEIKPARYPLQTSSLKWAAGALLLGWFAVSVYHEIASILALYNPLPVWDYWRVVDDYSAVRAGHLQPLWVQHNEHRILFPELVFQADMLWLHGRQVLPVALSFLLYTGTWLMLSACVFADRSVPRAIASFGSLLGAIVLLWEGAAFVLSVPFLLVWSSTLFGTATALICLSKAPRRCGSFLLWAALLAGTVATYSEANGLLVWPLLIAIALSLRFDKRLLAVLGVGALINIGCYFIGYHSLGSMKADQLVRHPIYALCFVASYLSMPFGAFSGPSPGLIAGLLLLAGSCTCIGIGVSRGWMRNSTFLVFTTYFLFFVFSALLTASGRMNPADPTYGGAKAVRYLILPEMAWCTFLLFAFWTLARVSRPSYSFALAAIVALAWAYISPRLRDWIEVNAEPFVETQLATISVESGTPDNELGVSHLYPDPRVLDIWTKRLKEERKSVFYRGRNSWLGKPAGDFAPSRPEINGAITGFYPIGNGFQIIGWADDLAFRKRYTYLVLTDEAGRIAGFARRFPSGFPRSASTPGNPASLGWAGYVSSALAGKIVHAQVLDARKFGLMPIAAPLRVPEMQAVQSIGGDPISVSWKRETNGNGQDVPVPPEPVKAPANIAGTYSGADSFTGRVRSTPFSRPADGCLIVPILNGPTAGGLSARLEDADSGAVLEQFPLRNWRLGWHYWKIQVPRQAQRLLIAADDNGRDWGEWVAVAAPVACSAHQ